MTNIIRILKFVFLDFWRNIWLSINTITIISLSLLSVNFLIIITILVNQAVVSVEDRVNISVYFKASASEAEVEAVNNRLQNEIKLKSSQIITPAEALERFQIRYQNDPEIIAALNELNKNPFSYGLVVQADKLADYALITGLLEEPAYTKLIEDKDFTDLATHERAIARVHAISRRAEQIGLGITLVLIFNSILVVLNAIRLNIYTHREEIAIMKLVGAPNWMIRSPFIGESLLYSFFAIIVTVLIFYPLIQFIEPFLQNLLGQPDFHIINYYLANFITLVGWQILGISALMVLASTLAIRRYLKV